MSASTQRSGFEPKVPEAVAAGSSRGLRVAVIGSSVAMGPKAGPGWAQHLAAALKKRYGRGGDGTPEAVVSAPLPGGCSVVNFAESGATTREALSQLCGRCAAFRPNVVVVGLALGNQGLAVNPTAAYESFERDAQFIIRCALTAPTDPAALQLPCALGAEAVLFGGQYPNDAYTRPQYELLLRMDRAMRGWAGVSGVFDFLSVTDDGHGHWRPELRADAAHPNFDGHRAMFGAIDVPSVFDPIVTRIRASRL